MRGILWAVLVCPQDHSHWGVPMPFSWLHQCRALCQQNVPSLSWHLSSGVLYQFTFDFVTTSMFKEHKSTQIYCGTFITFSPPAPLHSLTSRHCTSLEMWNLLLKLMLYVEQLKTRRRWRHCYCCYFYYYCHQQHCCHPSMWTHGDGGLCRCYWRCYQCCSWGVSPSLSGHAEKSAARAGHKWRRFVSGWWTRTRCRVRWSVILHFVVFTCLALGTSFGKGCSVLFSGLSKSRKEERRNKNWNCSFCPWLLCDLILMEAAHFVVLWFQYDKGRFFYNDCWCLLIHLCAVCTFQI